MSTLKVFAWLALTVFIGRTMYVFFAGFSTARAEPNLALAGRIGYEVGVAMFVFLVAAIGAGIAAFVRRKERDADAGLQTGAFLILLLTGLMMHLSLAERGL